MDNDELREFVELFLGQKIVLSLARENDYFNDRRFTSRWSNELIDLEESQVGIIVDHMLEYFYENHIDSISDAELYAFFRRNSDNYRMPDFFRLQTIVLNDRLTANRVYQEALRNPDFDSLVLNYSNDQFARISNGRGPFLSRVDLEHSYDILFRSNIGDIIAPVEVDVGIFHVYKIIDRVQGAVRSFDEVRGQVTTKLMFEKMENFIENLVHINNIHVRIYEENLVPRQVRSNVLPFFGNNRIRELSRM
jgi:hypothetical protein